jgi:hypothetical protein
MVSIAVESCPYAQSVLSAPQLKPERYFMISVSSDRPGLASEPSRARADCRGLGESFDVVQAVADRAERRLVVPAVDGDGAGQALDRGGRLGQRHNLAAL